MAKIHPQSHAFCFTFAFALPSHGRPASVAAAPRYLRECAELEGWLATHVAQARAEELGASLEEVNALWAKHADLEKTVEACRGKVCARPHCGMGPGWRA